MSWKENDTNNKKWKKGFPGIRMVWNLKGQTKWRNTRMSTK